MAVRKPRKARTARKARGSASYAATTASVGGGDLAAAAEEIASGARLLAGTWAKTGAVVASIRVDVAGNTALITADAGAAYPAETRARHPLFGDREHWYGPPGEPFMGPAADQRAGAAMARYADKIDALCRKAGFS
jgi:hypothetical protein